MWSGADLPPLAVTLWPGANSRNGRRREEMRAVCMSGANRRCDVGEMTASVSGANRNADVREMTTACMSGANRKGDVREITTACMSGANRKR